LWTIPIGVALIVGCSPDGLRMTGRFPPGDEMNAEERPASDPINTPENASSQPLAKQDLPKTDEDWRKRLTPEQYYVMRQRGTERPGTSKFITFDKDGAYKCVGCGEVLFKSDTKFDHGCGWPSFTKAANDGAIGTRADFSHFMRRTEVHCNHCGAHLGHVFDDGPSPLGTRFCINGVALDFESTKKDGE
jgi:peptide-methionine (R)-S-oxide reductase